MKFKEFRMLCINAVLLIIMIIGMFFLFSEGQVLRGLLGSFILLLMVVITLGKYTLKVFDDSLLGYEYKGIGIMPILIGYKDIKEIELVSTHKIKVEHAHKTTLYVTNAAVFYQEVQEKMKTNKKDGK